MNQGFTLNMTYNGLRMALGSATGQEELFSVDDVAEMTDMSHDEVLQEIENARKELSPMKKSVFYFPGGLSDLIS